MNNKEMEFSRGQLKIIKSKADFQADRAIKESWKRVYQRLSDAVNELDAYMIREKKDK